MANNYRHLIILFMATGTALASGTNLENFVIICSLDFALFSIAAHLKDKILLASFQNQTESAMAKRSFIFLGEDLKSDRPSSGNHAAELTPDERYIILASTNLQLKRILFSFFLSFLHYFLTSNLTGKNQSSAPFGLIGGAILFLATIWIFFRVWKAGQMPLVLFMNWCGVAFLARGNASLLCLIIPIYLTLSFHLLQMERDQAFRPLWSVSWAYSLKICGIWGLGLLLMGSLLPNQLLNSFNRQLQRMERVFSNFGQKPKSSLAFKNNSSQALQNISDSLAKQIQSMSGNSQEVEEISETAATNSSNLPKSTTQNMVRKMREEMSEDLSSDLTGTTAQDLEQLKNLEAEARRLADKIEQEGGLNSEELEREMQQFSQQLSEANLPPEKLGQDQKSLSDKLAPPTAKWDRFKNILIKIVIVLVILLLAKLFEKKSESLSQESPDREMVTSFKQKWKKLLSARLEKRTFILEAYQLLAEANQAFSIAEKAFCPPLIVYKEIPYALYQKEWPTVAKTFLRTFYGEQDINRAELKLFVNAADRLFNVYFTKSPDQAITAVTNENGQSINS